MATIGPEHEAQLLNYLKATNIEVGLLLNFGSQPEIRRKAFDNVRERPELHVDADSSQMKSYVICVYLRPKRKVSWLKSESESRLLPQDSCM